MAANKQSSKRVPTGSSALGQEWAHFIEQVRAHKTLATVSAHVNHAKLAQQAPASSRPSNIHAGVEEGMMSLAESRSITQLLDKAKAAHQPHVSAEAQLQKDMSLVGTRPHKVCASVRAPSGTPKKRPGRQIPSEPSDAL